MQINQKTTARIFFAAIFVFGLFVFFAGSILVSSANCGIGAPPSDLPAQIVCFPSASGAMLHGWLVPGQAGQGAIVLLHGIRGNRLQLLDNVRFLFHAGYSVLVFDFQAHGESPGEHVTAGYLESRDAVAAVNFARQRMSGEKIGVIGFSMGGAAALLAEPPLAVNALILESVYPTIEQAIANRLEARFGWLGRLGTPFLTWQLRPRLGFGVDDLRPIYQVGKIKIPKFFIAGTADHLTTLKESQNLFQAAAEPKQYWWVNGAGHVDMDGFARAEYETRVLEFLAKAMN